jgi:hypothetical protein
MVWWELANPKQNHHFSDETKKKETSAIQQGLQQKHSLKGSGWTMWHAVSNVEDILALSFPKIQDRMMMRRRVQVISHS